MSRLAFTLSLLLPALLLSAIAVAPPAQSKGKKNDNEPFTRVIAEKIKLTDKFSKAEEVELGNELGAVAKLHITEWFDTMAISGQVDVENTTDHEIFTSYHLAFFDKKDNLLGCASQTLSFDPGEETMIGGALIQMPAAQLEKVAKYRITWYEDTVKIGSRGAKKDD